ncbi:DUF1793-domain-containing protein [Mycena olivaceomarginata]|nr:DUF1793-domain-containing protein [Mycena olivaceomarginata]
MLTLRFFPSAVPLAVRTPTFSCWLDTRNGSNPMSSWPQFWNDQHILGWAGYIKVDGLAYHWLGDPGPGNASTWLATAVTPTRTILTVQAGPMRLNVTFLSPIEPGDWARQSFPFSYVYLDGKSTDGQPHSIQLYSDISGGSSQTSNTVFHQVGSTTPSSTFKDMAEDAIAYYAISSAQPNLVSVVGTDQALRPQFAAAGEGFTLTADLAGNIGNVEGGDGKFPVLAHALNLGTTDTITTVAWAVGVVRDPILTFAGVPRRAYYWSQHGTVGDAIDAFMTDFPAARARAIALDQKILQDAAAVSPEYADLVSLATRQAMAGIEITLSTLPDGSFNMSDVKAFMKDVGNSQRVNPTEAIYAALPAFMYLDANITGALLEPLLEYQGSSSYSNSYAAPEFGFVKSILCTPFPSVPGNPGNNVMYGVENSGNMLILVLAHAQSSGDGSLIGKYYDLLKRWGDYLISNALIPGQQTPADARDTGLAQTHGNITNLALKGIIAIQAMAEISQVMGQTADEQKYETAAKSLMQSWINLTSVSGQLRWTYGASTFGLMYNLLADKLLKLNVVPASIYTTEASILSTNPPQQAFGIALSSDSNSNTRSDWTLFSAAAADNQTRDLLISGVHNHASSNLTGGTFPTLYNVQTGQGPGVGASPNGFASPAQGAMFSVLALNVANKTVVVPSPAGSAPPASSSGVPSAKSNAGAIAGGVVGGVAVLLLLGGVAIFLRRRRGQRDRNDGLEAPRPYQAPPNMVAVFGDSSVAPTSPSANSNHVPPSRAPAELQAASGQNQCRLLRPHISVEQRLWGLACRAGLTSCVSEMERLRYEVLPQEAPPGYH